MSGSRCYSNRCHMLAGGVALLMVTACGASDDPRDHRDFERMRRQMRYETYGTSAHFTNGGAMQTPPLHSVSVEVNAVDTVASAAAIAVGQRQYAISCAPCHGSAGFGGGPVAPNLVEARPVSLRSAKVANLDGRAIVDIITNGKDRMPPLGWQLAPNVRWAVAAYVRTLGSAPANGDLARADSLLADRLRHLDSLHAAHAPVRSILELDRSTTAR